MRILIATDQWFPDFKGGSARIATESAAALAELDHELVVIAPATPGTARSSEEAGVEVLRVLPRNALPQTLVDVVKTRSIARRLSGPFDVLLGHQATTAVGLSSALPQTPLVRVFHASAVREASLRRASLPFGPRRLATASLVPLLSMLERTALKRSAGVLVLSEYSGSLLRSDYGSLAGRVERVPGGIDAEAFSPQDDRAPGTGPARLLAVRRLEACLGLETLLDALAIVRDRRPVELALVGTGPLEARLRARSAELGLEEVIEFAGDPPQSELRERYRHADLVVMPPALHEGFGRATVESLASGTPVVAAPVGANPELLTPLEPKLLAEGSDPASLADAIDRALDLDAGLRGKCRDYAVHRFAWPHAIHEWERALVHAAEARSAHAARAEAELSTGDAR